MKPYLIYVIPSKWFSSLNLTFSNIPIIIFIKDYIYQKFIRLLSFIYQLIFYKIDIVDCSRLLYLTLFVT